MRDDFPPAVKEILAKRVGYRCSNPDCRQATSGPQVDPAKATNIGVAAHITAASPDGPRYDASLTPEQRRSVENGIWLCQNHGKLVDNDDVRYSVALLREWKRIAELLSERELQNPRANDSDDPELQALAKVERLMPDLIAAMRQDLQEHPLMREFVILKKGWAYNTHDELYLAYFYEDHSDLDSKLHVLENLGFIGDVTRTNVSRFRFSEAFVELLARTAHAARPMRLSRNSTSEP